MLKGNEIFLLSRLDMGLGGQGKNMESPSTVEIVRRPKAKMGRKLDENWRYQNSDLVSKMFHILQSGLFHDVTFEVGDCGIQISAHKFILIVNSKVFEAMFCGGLAPAEGEIISVPDIQPKAFKAFLQFIYTGDSDVQVEDAINVLYAAKKYDIPLLVDRCVNLLLANMNESIVVSAYQAAELLDEVSLQKSCHDYIIKRFWKIVNTNDFLTMSHKNLCYFISQDELNILELDLFQATLRWAEEECFRQEVDVTPKNKRRVLNWVLNQIRFPVMSLDELSISVVPTRVLLADELVSLYQHMTVSQKKKCYLPKLWFNDAYRRQYKRSYTVNFAGRITIEAYDYDMNAFREDSFEVDHPVSIVSVGFPAPDFNEPIKYDTTVKLKTKDGEVLSERHVSVQVAPCRVFHIDFPQPIPIKANTTYTVRYRLKGPMTHYIEKKCKEIKIFYDADDIIHFKYFPHHRQLIELKFTVV